MYIDLGLLFLIYAFATISLAVSVYALWTLKELEEFYKKRNSKNRSTTTYYPPVTGKSRAKGHWD